MKKRGQLSISDAPSVVMIVGLTFLIMATLAFVSAEYGGSFPADESATVANESVSRAARASGYFLTGGNAENAQSLSITSVKNGTGAGDITVNSGNYSVSGFTFTNTTDEYPTTWYVTYSYSYSGSGANITTDLNTEIANNTSIAGIVLTISLVGIVLSVLIGIFVIARNRGL